MGLAIATDIFQHFMSILMQDLEFCRVYFDDFLCITRDSFEEHLEKLQLVFERLTKANLKINAPKSNFCTQTLEYLGYLLIPKEIYPLTNKTNAIIRIKRPTTSKQLSSFLRMADLNRDSWAKRSHILTPLTNLIKEVGSRRSRLPWRPEHEIAKSSPSTLMLVTTN